MKRTTHTPEQIVPKLREADAISASMTASSFANASRLAATSLAFVWRISSTRRSSIIGMLRTEFGGIVVSRDLIQ